MDVFVVGGSGTIVRWNGVSWLPMASGTTRSLLAVWGTSATSAFSVGSGGTILRWDGTLWAPMTSGTTEDLYGVWGTSPTNAYAVGNGGTILRWDGASWTSVISWPPGVRPALFGVQGTAPGRAYAVGMKTYDAGSGTARGTILRWDGSTWIAMSSGTGNDLRAVAPAALFAVGTGAMILRGVR
jgi:hypothetical protein